MKMVLKFTSIILFAISLNSCAQETKGDEEVETPNNVIEIDDGNNIPPAEGAVALSIHAASNSGAGYGCDISTYVVLGEVPPRVYSQGELWVDGQDSHEVTCIVNGNDTYNFLGEISSDIGRFSIVGYVVKDGTGTANINLIEAGSGMVLNQDDCEITISKNIIKENGLIWANFDCPKFLESDDIYTWCSAQGTFVFKNCENKLP